MSDKIVYTYHIVKGIEKEIAKNPRVSSVKTTRNRWFNRDSDWRLEVVMDEGGEPMIFSLGDTFVIRIEALEVPVENVTLNCVLADENFDR